MLFLNLDLPSLDRDLHALTLDAIHLKGVLRTRWLRPMADEQRRLVRVRRELTERLVLLALSRGKLHVRKRPRDLALPAGDDAPWDAEAHARTVAARLLPDYPGAGMMPEARS
jgi:hypothetical protein